MPVSSLQYKSPYLEILFILRPGPRWAMPKMSYEVSFATSKIGCQFDMKILSCLDRNSQYKDKTASGLSYFYIEMPRPGKTVSVLKQRPYFFSTFVNTEFCVAVIIW